MTHESPKPVTIAEFGNGRIVNIPANPPIFRYIYRNEPIAQGRDMDDLIHNVHSYLALVKMTMEMLTERMNERGTS